MALVRVDAADTPAYRLDVTTIPQAVVAGRTFRLQLTVRHPLTDAVVKDFAVVHEKRFHLFIISQDLEHYDHVHPEQQDDGAWTIDVTLPRPGSYKIYTDFLPAGGSPQVISHPLVSSDFNGGAAPGEPRLEPDRDLKRVAGDLSVALALPSRGLVAGREETFVYTLTDARTGNPVRDVEPYLGAWGHSLAVSADMLSVVHAHPAEHVPEGRSDARGGPVLTFKAALPEPGAYRIWTQFKRNGEITTVVFTVTAGPQAGHGG